MTEQSPENEAFLTEQILTYLGNKRALLNFIGSAIKVVKSALGQDKLSMFDVFSGSGIVSRFFKQHASHLYVNDLEAYSNLINRCYLANAAELPLKDLHDIHERLQSDVLSNLHEGFITELYAPKDETHIQLGERVFYTHRNAMYIDTARQAIGQLPEDIQPYFLAPLLIESSIHNNTAGVFKGFYKNKEGIGQYGGTARNALYRILGDINIPFPVFSNFSCDTSILQEDSANAITHVPEIDIAYLDPPYNQHPYGSNYFMLNLILNYQRPDKISRVSGIPRDWNRSTYNKRLFAQETLFSLVTNIKAKYVLISYNSEGFIHIHDFVKHLLSLGHLTMFNKKYSTFRGCRNLKSRDIHVREYLFLLKKS